MALSVQMIILPFLAEFSPPSGSSLNCPPDLHFPRSLRIRFPSRQFSINQIENLSWFCPVNKGRTQNLSQRRPLQCAAPSHLMLRGEGSGENPYLSALSKRPGHNKSKEQNHLDKFWWISIGFIQTQTNSPFCFSCKLSIFVLPQYPGI